MLEGIKEFLKKQREPRSVTYITVNVNPNAGANGKESVQLLYQFQGKTTTLPIQHIEDKTLANLKEGEFGYTVPWAMSVTQDLFCFLNGEYTYTKSPHDTSMMLVERSEKGYLVTIPYGYKYHPSRTPIPWVGASVKDLIPVYEIKSSETSIKS